MNYRHAFHAGNFADVMKHIVLVRVIEHLKRKNKPFRFIDTHAGTGLYDISSDEAQRSGEWRGGIGAILEAENQELLNVPAGSALADLLKPYLEVIQSVNGISENKPGTVRYYPGAGEFARRLMRDEDRLILNELHPEDARALRRVMQRDERAKVLQLDGWMALKSVLPPKERRGVTLIDPPFEAAGEFQRLEAALDDATSRFATGTTMLWYPIKEGGAADAFIKRMAKSDHSRLLGAELLIRHRDTRQGLNGSGLIIHNPPFDLHEQLDLLLPWLVLCLAQQAGAEGRAFEITGE